MFMLSRYQVIFVLLAAAMAVSFCGTSEARIVKSRADLNFGPRVVGYNEEKDELVRQTSILTRPDRRPGGNMSYSGTRLKQYQFHGKPGRGGIYDALEEYHNELKLDPKLYQYRRHRGF
jgi:hypothetical protein